MFFPLYNIAIISLISKSTFVMVHHLAPKPILNILGYHESAVVVIKLTNNIQTCYIVHFENVLLVDIKGHLRES